jgi:putative transposase
MEKRKYTYKLYPKPSQVDGLLDRLRLHQQLYNAALQERIECYRKTGETLTYNDQQKSLTEIRSFSDEYRAIACTESRMTLRRLDKAFKSFFNRVKKGQTPGFPRFKSLKRFSSFEMLDTKFTPNDNWKHGKLFIKGIGHIKARGKARVGGTIKTSQVTYRHGNWWLSLTVDCEPQRQAEKTLACGIDWGVRDLLMVSHDNGDYYPVKNPRYFKNSREEILKLEQLAARKKKGSNRWLRIIKRIGKAKSKLARKRQDDHHKLSNDIAKNYALVSTEKLKIKNMTSSAKGTLEKPGKNVKQKSGLNREILDTAPASLLAMIRYKVEETGGEFVETPTQKLKPSQRCPSCDHTSKDNRPKGGKLFQCVKCDLESDADAVGAYNNISYALGLGQELAYTGKPVKPLLSVA